MEIGSCVRSLELAGRKAVKCEMSGCRRDWPVLRGK